MVWTLKSTWITGVGKILAMTSSRNFSDVEEPALQWHGKRENKCQLLVVKECQNVTCEIKNKKRSQEWSNVNNNKKMVLLFQHSVPPLKKYF